MSGREWFAWAGLLLTIVAVSPVLGADARLVGYALRFALIAAALRLGARLRSPRSRPRGFVRLDGPAGTRAELIAVSLFVGPIIAAIVLINLLVEDAP